MRIKERELRRSLETETREKEEKGCAFCNLKVRNACLIKYVPLDLKWLIYFLIACLSITWVGDRIQKWSQICKLCQEDKSLNGQSDLNTLSDS